MPPQPFDEQLTQVKKIEDRNADSLSQEDKDSLESWKVSYAQWQKDQKTYDQANVDKKNQLATSVSMLVVGIPVLLFHQKELRKKTE